MGAQLLEGLGYRGFPHGLISFLFPGPSSLAIGDADNEQPVPVDICELKPCPIRVKAPRDSVGCRTAPHSLPLCWNT